MIRPRTAGIIVAVCILLGGTIDYAAAKVSHLMLLENSSQPALGDECARAAPARGRPAWTVSRQQRTGEPWHHRTCAWAG